MAIDIDEGGAKTVPIEGARCTYVLSVVAPDGLEVSVFDNSPTDLGELKEALAAAVAEKRPTVLLREDLAPGGSRHWLALEPELFAARLAGA